MSTLQYSTKLSEEQIEILKRVSTKTHIPQAVLVRQALDMFFKQLKTKESSLSFLSIVKEKIKEDKALLKKLARS